MKDNGKVIHFQIKGRGVKGLVIDKITFEKSTTHHTQNSILKTEKLVFMKLVTFFISKSQNVDVFSEKCYLLLKVQ